MKKKPMCGFVCFVNENNLSKTYLNLANSGKLSNHRGPDSQKYLELKISLHILEDYLL